MVDDLIAREQDLLKLVSSLKTDKQRLEDTIYRLKTEGLANTVALKQLEEKVDGEKIMNVSKICVCGVSVVVLNADI